MFEPAINDYVDGSLQGLQKKEVEKHLGGCSRCRRVCEDLKEVKARLKSLRKLKTSPDFVTVLRTRISMERSLSRRGFGNWQIRIPVYLTAGVAVILVTAFLFNPLKNSFITDVTNVPSNSFSSELTNSNPSIAPKQVFQDQPDAVNYPWDVVNPKGFRSSSERTERPPTTNPDSLRNSYKIHTVELEF